MTPDEQAKQDETTHGTERNGHMIKILWNHCEVEMRHSENVIQCETEGETRTFADGGKAVMCNFHWNKCTGIVDKDGTTRMKPAGGGAENKPADLMEALKVAFAQKFETDRG
jgi:hypothetical protein